MSEVIPFVPKRDLDARANLAEFIALCRDKLTVFGADLDWSSNRWPQSHVTFGNLDHKGGVLDPALVMQQPFLDFAKAYHRYRQGMRPAANNLDMRALKCLERALSESKTPPSIEDAKGFIFDRAAVLCAEAYSVGVAYRAGCELEAIAEFLIQKNLVAGLLPWRNTISRPKDSVRTGVEAKRQREKKLPKEEMLDAIATIFASGPTVDRDIFTSSTSALLLCAPSRGGEILRLPVDCEVTETKRDGTTAYGWRFFTSKNGLPMIKWIPDVMVEIAKEAVSRIRRITEEARIVAAWLEDHPDEFYHHKQCPLVGEDEPLSVEQIGLALGYTVVRPHELRRFGIYLEAEDWTLRKLNKWVHARLPKTFPWFDAEQNLRFRDALFCMRERQLRTDMGASPVVLWRPTVNTLNDDLGKREVRPGYVLPNVFVRNAGLLGGTVGKVTSHQFRHHLNTLAQRGGLAQSEIAKWSGRADPKQNRVYNHMSEHELAGMLREHDPALKLGSALTELAEDLSAKMPMTRQEFNMLAAPTVHVTEFGFCVHDFVMSPCQRFRDCLNCTEQVCIKGDRRLPQLKERLEIVREQVSRAQAELQDGSIGADRWLEVHMETAKRLEQLISILEDPGVEDGAVIRLNSQKEFSLVRRALESIAAAQDSPNALPHLIED